METIVLLIIAIAFVIAAYRFGLWLGAQRMTTSLEEREEEIRRDAIARSRATLGGQFSEQLAPYLPNFPYSPTEVRFMGKPIDFLVFKGMDEKSISEVIFVEVKSGRSKTNAHERRLKEVIDQKKVRWEEYRVPEEITKKEMDA